MGKSGKFESEESDDGVADSEGTYEFSAGQTGPPVEEDVIVDISSGKPKGKASKIKQRKSSVFSQQLVRKNAVHLTFEDLQYSVKVREKKCGSSEKQILKGIAGYVKAGQVLAIMGSSGAGKTSLLNVLAGRFGKGTVGGTLKVNGHLLDTTARKSISQISGYVMQDDVLMPSLTVRETLRYSALLRLPGSMKTEEKEERVDNVIRELGLNHAKDTMIGTVVRKGISGGERKRVNIGVELITDPSLIFLDEPTSGLDSFTAYNIMETLLSIAQAGRTVVCTIHQPRSNIYSLFDMVMLLSSGRVAYFGPASRAVEYFTKLNFVCPQYANPADYLLDISCIDSRTEKQQEESTKQVQLLLSSYSQSDLYTEQMGIIERLASTESTVKLDKPGFATSLLTQFIILFGRGFKNFHRARLMNGIRLFQTVLFAIIIGLIYLRIDNDQSSVGDRVGALFFIIINQAFGAMFGVLNAFPAEKSVFMRERASRMYRVLPYYLTKSASELPGQILFPILFSVVAYYMIGFQPDFDKFLVFTAVLILASFTALSMGMAISAAAPSIEWSNTLAPLILVILLLFGGFYVNTENIPLYFTWIQWLSFVKYSFTALMLNEFKGLTLRCTDSQLVELEGGQTVCPITQGEQVLVVYGLDGNLSLSECFLGLLVLIFAFRLLGYLFLRFTAKKF